MTPLIACLIVAAFGLGFLFGIVADWIVSGRVVRREIRRIEREITRVRKND